MINKIAFFQKNYFNTSTIGCTPGNIIGYPQTVNQSTTVYKDWTNLSNLIGDNTSTFTNVSIKSDDPPNDRTEDITASNFGLTLDSGKVPVGLEFNFLYDLSLSSGAECVFYPLLQVSTDDKTGTNYGSYVDLSAGTNNIYTLGGPTNLLGLTTLNNTDIDSDLKIKFNFINEGQAGRNATVSLKRIQLKVYYECA